jgi:uncharacterized protein YidB (DUF937 family)
MSKKGQKNLRGQPEKWKQLKKRVTMSLTPKGVDGLDALASDLGLSRSELVERIGRRVIPLQVDAITESGTMP